MKYFKLGCLIVLYAIVFILIPVFFTLNSGDREFYSLLILSNCVGFTLVGAILKELDVWSRSLIFKILMTALFTPVFILITAFITVIGISIYKNFLEVGVCILILCILLALVGLFGWLIQSLFKE